MQISEQFAKYVINLHYEEIPSEVIHFTKLCIIDYFSSAIAGSEKQPVQLISELITEMGGHDQATLMNGKKSSALFASMYNGAAAHIVELDDIHKSSIVHAATVIIPPALAIAEWKGLSGKQLIEAVIAGYEISFRIGEAVSPSHYYYFHNTATCGTFGAAIASAKLLQLDEEQVVMALGSAGTQAAGLWEFIEDGAMSKQLHTAKAAQNGMLSALLAEKGFTGARKILEGKRGFIRAMSDANNNEVLTKNLYQSYKITENSFKIHASCRHVHAATDLALQLHNENVNENEVDQMIVRTYQVAIDITDNPFPKTMYEAKFSMQFCVALAFVYGESDLHAFTEERIFDDKILQVMNKVVVKKDDTIDRQYPNKWGTEIDVIFTNGTKQIIKTNFPKGDPENPLTTEEVIDKFQLMTRKLTSSRRNILLDLLIHLEDVSSIQTVMDVISKRNDA